MLRHIDLVALVGANAAWESTVARMPVAGGRLNITFNNVVRPPCARGSRTPAGSAGRGLQIDLQAGPATKHGGGRLGKRAT